MSDADMTQVKQDFSDLITSVSENVSSVTISSVLPDTIGARDGSIKEIKNILKDKCRDSGARLVDNDQNYLFRDVSCDTPAFQNDASRRRCSTGAAIHQDRLETGRRNSVAACRLIIPGGGCFGFDTCRRMVRPTSLSLLNSATVDSAHSSSRNLSGGNLRIVISVHGLNQ